MHALVLVFLAIGASDAKRLSAPTSSNETASNETASNESALKQTASNVTALNRTRLAWGGEKWGSGGENEDICAKKDPCMSSCSCRELPKNYVDKYMCKWKKNMCAKEGPPCYNGVKKQGDCCKSCPSGPNCLIWGRLLQPDDIFQNPGNKAEYAECGTKGFKINTRSKKGDNGFFTSLSFGVWHRGGRYPVPN